jgi:nucleotide-binding universal stress UspA family protein
MGNVESAPEGGGGERAAPAGGLAGLLRPWPTSDGEPRAVVITLDPSCPDSALSACRWAARTLCAGNSTAHLVTVLEPESIPLVAPPGEQACLGIDDLEPPTPSAAALKRAARILGSCRAELEAAGVKPAATTQTTLVSGVNGSAGVGDLLCGFAVGKGADALVTGSRGLGGVHRAALGLLGLGSVSDYVVRHAQARRA